MWRKTKIKTEMVRRAAVILPALALAFVFGFAPAVFAVDNASLQLGDSRPDETTAYTFDASGVDTGSTVGCFELDFGTASDGSGDPGLDGTGGSVSSNGFLAGATDFNWDDTDKKLQATIASPASPSSASGSIVFADIVNGSTADTGYFAIFQTYSDTSCTTANSGETITVQFIYTDGQDVSVTVDPSFSFTVGDVLAGQTVNGATTSVGTTTNTIAFGQPSTTSNEIAAQDLTITTNAQNGYNIYVQSFSDATGTTGALYNGSDEIPFHAAPHDTPTSFPEGAGLEDFGYTTEDQDVESGAFDNGTGLNLWAGSTFGSAQNQIATGTSAVGGGETTRVGYQVGIASATPSGTYTATVVYTAVPTY